MHDPMTLAFQIECIGGFEIWHCDPETDGSDDSCRWSKYRKHWWQHPKWHVHHWRVKWLPIFRFKRWAFSRCYVCHCRFAWGEAPISMRWSGGGPRWFRGEERVCHYGCYTNMSGEEAKE